MVRGIRGGFLLRTSHRIEDEKGKVAKSVGKLGHSDSGGSVFSSWYGGMWGLTGGFFLLIFPLIVVDETTFEPSRSTKEREEGKEKGGKPPTRELEGEMASKGTLELRSCFSSLIALFLLVLFAAALFSNNAYRRQEERALAPTIGSTPREEKCDLFSGRWVYDNGTLPLYSGLGCTFMHDELACDKFGRKDSKYQKWRWQPHGCNLPRFKADNLLKKLRGKRLVFVGDSLNRNQWVSMVCMLESSIPTQQKSMSLNGSLMSFKAKEFNVSVDFYWSPLLVESNCDDPIHHRLSDRIMRANSIEKHAAHWTNADVLVFNSYLWWRKPNMKMKVLYGPFEEEDKNFEEVEMIQGFEMALKAWSGWLESHINTSKTMLYFVSFSPTHFRAEQWGISGNRNCYNETEPIAAEGYTSTGSDYSFMWVVEAAVEELRYKGVDVQILNITQLSEYRKDGHPSIYRKQWAPLSEDQLANPSSYADCQHWCLPGVPDTWNELLYAHIISR